MPTRGGVLALGPVARRPAELTLAHATFLIGVFVAPFHLRFSAVNFTAVSDAATLAAAVLIVLGRRPFHFSPSSLLAAAYAFLLFAALSTFRAPQPEESVTQILEFAFTFFVQLPVILTLARSRLVVNASLGLLLAARLVDAPRPSSRAAPPVPSTARVRISSLIQPPTCCRFWPTDCCRSSAAPGPEASRPPRS
jgi:hypothetical protein